jgi:uncharacterized protein (DUF305 family)
MFVRKNAVVIRAALRRFASSAVAAGLAVLTAGTAHAQAQMPMDHGSMHMPAAAAQDGADSPSTQAYQSAMQRMHKDMAIPYSGNADVDFARGMIPHHQGAIDMAKTELQYGRDPELRKLAQEVIDSQQKEVAFLQSWLRKNGK